MSESVKHVTIKDGIPGETVNDLINTIRSMLLEIVRGLATVDTLTPNQELTINYKKGESPITLLVSVNSEGTDATLRILSRFGGKAVLIDPYGNIGIRKELPDSSDILSGQIMIAYPEDDKNGDEIIRHIFFIDKEDGVLNKTFERIIRSSSIN